MISKRYVLTFVTLSSLYQPSSCTTDWGETVCMVTHCLPELFACEIQPGCRTLLECLDKCGDQDAECAFTCGMNGEAGRDPLFLDFLYCALENECEAKYPESGVCLAADDQALPSEDYSMIEGDWWTVYGQNCGQGIWTGAYDWLPCTHARIREEEGGWISNITYCFGQDSVCEGDLMKTVPKVYWTKPGVLRLDYPQEEAPLVPQIVDWKWLWMSEDWALVAWCGSNPMITYNGAFLLSRTRSNGTLPPQLEREVREEMAKYGLNLDTMCVTDSTQCTV